MDNIFKEMIEQVSLFAPRIGVGLLVFFSFWIASIVFQKIIRRIGRKGDKRLEDVFHLIGQAVKVTLIILGAVTALGTMGINVTALVAGLGLTGFAIGFALKDALSNLLAGVLILIYQPFQTNDFISVAGFEGIVIEIDLRYTTLQGEDKKILIPNSVLFTKAVSLVSAKK